MRSEDSEGREERPASLCPIAVSSASGSSKSHLDSQETPSQAALRTRDLFDFVVVSSPVASRERRKGKGYRTENMNMQSSRCLRGACKVFFEEGG